MDTYDFLWGFILPDDGLTGDSSTMLTSLSPDLLNKENNESVTGEQLFKTAT